MEQEYEHYIASQGIHIYMYPDTVKIATLDESININVTKKYWTEYLKRKELTLDKFTMLQLYFMYWELTAEK